MLFPQLTEHQDDFLDLKELSQRVGKEDGTVHSFLVKIFETSQAEVRYAILTNIDGDISAVHALLRKLADVACLLGPKGLSDEILFVTHVLHGLGYCRWVTGFKYHCV